MSTHKENYEHSIRRNWPDTCLHYWDEKCKKVRAYFEGGPKSVDIWNGRHCRNCADRKTIALSTYRQRMRK